jgi:hypothetical protein
MAELQAAFDAGDYRGVLRDVGRALPVKGKAAEAYDHYDLLMLRAESFLRLKESAAAAAAFEQAVKESTNDKQRAEAIAMQILTTRSGRLAQYTPQKPAPGQKKDPIDIIDADHRKAALAALYNDEATALAADIKAAKAAPSLPPIAQALRAMNLRKIRMLEMVATGADKESQQTMNDLRAHAQDLMSRALEREAKRTDEIGASADETIHQQILIPRTDGHLDTSEYYRRRGLSTSQSSELKGIISDCTQMMAAIQSLAEATGDTEKRLSDTSTLSEQANDLRVKADRILRADYSVR